MPALPEIPRYATLACVITRAHPEADIRQVLHACMQACAAARSLRAKLCRASATANYGLIDTWAAKKQRSLQLAFDLTDKLPPLAVWVILERDDPRGAVGHLKITQLIDGQSTFLKGDGWAQGGDGESPPGIRWPLF